MTSKPCGTPSNRPTARTSTCDDSSPGREPASVTPQLALQRSQQRRDLQERTSTGSKPAITVGVGKTHLATALGHIAVRRRRTVAFYRADQLFRRLKAARLDNTVEAEMRRLARLDLLIIDDLALQAMDSVETADFYELVVERHHKTSTVVTSNRDPSEWIALKSDPLLAQSAVDRLVATSYELVVEGESYRRRQRPTTAPQTADNGVS